MRPIVPNPNSGRVIDTKGGAHSTSIQSIINGIPIRSVYDKDWTILLYPGIYEENIDIGFRRISLVGMSSSKEDVIITANTGTILGGTVSISNLTLLSEGTAVLAAKSATFQRSQLTAYNCLFKQFTRVDNPVNPPAMFVMDGSIHRFSDCDIVYEHEDEIVTPPQTNTIFLSAGPSPSRIQIFGGSISAVVDDENDFIGIDTTTVGLTYIIRNCLVDIVTDDTTPNTTFIKERSLFGYPEFTLVTARMILGCTILMRKGSALLDSDGTVYDIHSADPNLRVHSIGNKITLSGFDFNYAGKVPGGKLITHWDEIDAEHLFLNYENILTSHIHQDGEIHTDYILMDERLRSFRDISNFTNGYIDTSFQMVFNTDGSTGGELNVLDVSQGGVTGIADVTAIATHNDINVIHQAIGETVSLGKAWNVLSSVWTDATLAFQTSDPGPGPNNFAIFTDYLDQIYLGALNKFDELRFVLEVVASLDLLLSFEYWNSLTSLWTSFGPIDGTNGMTGSGTISFNRDNLENWGTTQVNGETDDFWYYIRITRNRQIVLTSPVEDLIEATLTFDGNWIWDKNGQVIANKLRSATVMQMPANIDDSGMTSTPGKRGYFLLNSDNKVYVCINPGSPDPETDPATWVAIGPLAP